MVASKKSVDWHAVESVTTPSQTRAYIDACKEWLLALPEEEDDPEINPPQDLPIAVDACEHHNNGMLRESICARNTFKCFICSVACEVPRGRVVAANPFTRSQCVLLCDGCAV